MKKIALVIAFVVLASCLCVLLTGCSGVDGKLIGTWKGQRTDVIMFKNSGKYTQVCQDGSLFEGRYEIRGDDELIMDGVTLRYKIEDDKLSLYLVGVLLEEYGR